MNTLARIKRPGTPVALVLALVLSACCPLAAVAAVPEFVGVLAVIVENEQVARELKLTPEQKEQLLELIDARENEAVELLDLPRDEQVEKLLAFRRESEAKGLELLNAEQLARLKEIRGRQTGSPAPPPEPTEVATDDPSKPTEVATDDPSKPTEVATDDPFEPTEVATDDPFEPTEDPADVPPEPAEGSVARPPVSMDAGQPPKKPGKLLFQCRYQPWKDVIEWFAEQADLSYVSDAAPQGTFNYLDSREYTPAEAIDLLNSVLLTKGYTLIRRDRMLMLINLEEGIPPNLISTIPLEKLDEIGEYSLVSVLFQLEKATSEEAEEEIKKLIGPQGAVVPLPKSRQILVTETAGRLRVIRSMIQRIEDPQGFDEKMQPFEIKFAMPEDVLTVVRQLLGVPEDKNATEDGSIRFALDPSGSRLFVTGKPEKLKKLEEIIKAVDVPGPNQLDVSRIDEMPQFEVYSITTADPESVLSVMQTLLTGLPDVRLSLDPKTDSLHALARPSEHATIKATLAQMQSNEAIILVDVIHLRKVDPQLAVLSINKLFNAVGEKAAKNAPQVDADPTSRQLLVRGTEAQIEQIRTLLDKMGESDAELAAAGGTGNVRMLPLTGRAAQSALERIQQLWPTMSNNPIRVVTPSAIAPTMRSGNGALPELQVPGQVPGTLRPRMPAPFRTLPRVPSSQRPAAEEPSRPPDDRRREHDHDHGRPSRDNSTGLFPRPRVFFAVQTVEAQPQPADSKTDETQVDETQVDEMPAEETEADGVPTEGTEAGEMPAAEPPAEVPAPEPFSEESQQPVAPSSAAPIIVSIGPGGIMIACQDVEALNAFEELLTTLTEGLANSGPELTIFYLKHATAAVVAQTLDQVLGGGTIATQSSGGGGGLIGDLAGAALGDGIMGALLGLGGGGGMIAPTGLITITPDARLNALVVQANPVDLDMIEQVLKILDQQGSPEDVQVVPKAKMIPVFNTQAQEIANILNQVYQDRMVTSSRGGSSGGRAPSPEDLMRMLRGSRGGSSRSGGNQGEEKQKMSLGIDLRTNSLIVAAPEPLLQEVEQLIWQLDAAAMETTHVMRPVTLHEASPEAVQRALSAMLGDSVQFSKSESRSSSSSASRPPSGGVSRPSSQPSDEARRAFFMDMMRRRSEGGGRPGGGRPDGGGRSGGGPPGR